MKKINNLRNKRVLNRYFFFQQELDLKEEMLEEMDIDNVFEVCDTGWSERHPGE